MTTHLPEPNFIDRDPTTITNEWIKLYEAKTGKTLQSAQIERILIDVASYRETLLRIKIQETAKLNLLNYASLDILKHIGEIVGVPILEAKYSNAKFIFVLDSSQNFDVTIPSGTQIESNDSKYIFETSDTLTIKANGLSVEGSAICTTAGESSNGYAIDSIANLITPLGYVISAKNTTLTSGGQDEESADNYRERIRQAPESFSNAGSEGAYKFHTLSADQSIIDVAVISPSPGVVEVYPLTASGNPSNDILKAVQTVLNSDKIRPLTDKVVVKSPEKIGFKIKAIITLYTNADTDSVLTAIKEKLAEYKNALAIKLGKDVIQTQIISILNNVYGVFKVDLTSPKDIDILEYQWASLDDFEISIGGYVDE